MSASRLNPGVPIRIGSVGDYVQDLRWSPDGRFLAAASISGPISVFPHPAEEPIIVLPGHAPGTQTIDWHPDSRRLVSGGQDARIRLWQVPESTQLDAWPAGADWIERVAWNRDGERLAWSAGRTLHVRDIARGCYVETPYDFPSTVADLDWAPRGRRLAASAYGGVWIWRPGEGKERRLLGWKGSSHLMRWSPDARFIATADQDMTVHFWFTDSGVDLRMSGFPGKIRDLAWESSSRYLATASGEMLAVWDCSGPTGPEGRTPIMLPGPAAVTRLAYAHAQPHLATGYKDGSVLLWPPGLHSVGQRLATFSDAGAIVQLDWSPDDHHLAVGTEQGEVFLLNIKESRR